MNYKIWNLLINWYFLSAQINKTSLTQQILLVHQTDSALYQKTLWFAEKHILCYPIQLRCLDISLLKKNWLDPIAISQGKSANASTYRGPIVLKHPEIRTATSTTDEQREEKRARRRAADQVKLNAFCQHDIICIQTLLRRRVGRGDFRNP